MGQNERFTGWCVPEGCAAEDFGGRFAEITIEDFDAEGQAHSFSSEYRKRKRSMLRSYRKDVYFHANRKHWRAAAAALALAAVTPAVVYAAAREVRFNRIWGNEGRENVVSHAETVYDETGQEAYTAAYPAREYVEIDEERARELIGANVSVEPVTEQIGDTTLTIWSVVYDGYSAVAEFTLEREGGVNALSYGQLDNEAKGAWFSDESDIWFHFVEAGEKIFVDLNRSAQEQLFCYDYIAFDNPVDSLSLELVEYPCTKGEYEARFQETGELMPVTSRTVSIPLGEAVGSVELTGPDGGRVELSPLSMAIDMKEGLGLSGDEAYDPGSVYYVAVNYKDGTTYLVCEDNRWLIAEDETMEFVHQAEEAIDNTSYALGRLDGVFVLVFNRLVDTDAVESITVNETTYRVP